MAMAVSVSAVSPHSADLENLAEREGGMGRCILQQYFFLLQI